MTDNTLDNLSPEANAILALYFRDPPGFEAMCNHAAGAAFHCREMQQFFEQPHAAELPGCRQLIAGFRSIADMCDTIRAMSLRKPTRRGRKKVEPRGDLQ